MYLSPLELPCVDAVGVEAVDARVHDGDHQVEQDDDGDNVVKVPHDENCHPLCPVTYLDEFRMARVKDGPGNQRRPKEAKAFFKIEENIFFLSKRTRLLTAL
jgi:hypothetical protein